MPVVGPGLRNAEHHIRATGQLPLRSQWEEDGLINLPRWVGAELDDLCG